MSHFTLTAAATLAGLCTLAGGGIETARAQPEGAEPECVMAELEVEQALQSTSTLRAAGPVTLYLNRDGGIFTPGEPNDSRTNISSVPDQTVEVPSFDRGDEEWEELVDCVAELFGPFDIDITDEDPGDVPHYEAVIGGVPTAFGLAPTVAGVSPFLSNCGVIDNSIVFVYPTVVGNEPRRLCETVAQEVAHSFGLDHQYLCEDPMTYLAGCGDKRFLFQDSVCGEFTTRDCKCSRTQNSARLLLDRIGPSDRPAVWLSRPSSGDVLAAGFRVEAAFTQTPLALELYVDGIMTTAVVPEDTGEPYQVFDFLTSDSLRTGTHRVEVIARFEEEQQRTVSALVEVEGVNARELVSEGCAAGGGGRGRSAAVGLLVALLLLRARARRDRVGAGCRVAARAGRDSCPARGQVAALVLIAAWTAQIGCTTSVFGDRPGDIESGCQGAGEIDEAIAVLWSASGGTCTGTLVAPRALVTAAHCVAGADAAGQPIVSVLDGRQYIAERVELHPDWRAGSPDDDVAAVILTRDVESVDPLAIAPEEPAQGEEFTLVGHGEWTPQDTADAERQALVGRMSDVGGRSFSYQEQVDDACLSGRGGGPVLAGGETDRLLGLHGEGDVVMRADQYACWLSCAASGSGLPPRVVEEGCDCSRADSRPCNDCGVEFLDFASGIWSTCQAAEYVRPCQGGLSCSAEGYCVP